MIRGIHGLLYSSDVGGGRLIFDFAEGDLGVHPAHGGQAGGHDVSFY